MTGISQHLEFDVEQARLGIDGNAAFALLGEELQVECEWVEIETDAYVGSVAWRRAEAAASNLAFHRLRARLPNRKFAYVFHPSHPDYRRSVRRRKSGSVV